MYRFRCILSRGFCPVTNFKREVRTSWVSIHSRSDFKLFSTGIISASKETDRERLKILYDGECPVCVTEINFLKWWSKKDNPVNFVDITKGEYKPEDHMGITYEEAMGNMHAIGPDKKIYKKMDAIRLMYNATGFGWFADFTENKFVKDIADNGYDLFAKHRFKLQGKTYEQCVSERCNIKQK